MVRSFEDRPVPPAVLERVLDATRRGPSAGFSQGFDLVVLEGAEQTALYWETTTTARWRERAPRRAGLLGAPVVLLPVADRDAYLARYGEADKRGSGLEREEAWPVPYWTVDTAFAVMLGLLAAVDEGLGALFMGIFRGEAELVAALGIPDGRRPIGAVVLGWPAPDRPSPSAARGRRPAAEVIHRGRW